MADPGIADGNEINDDVSWASYLCTSIVRSPMQQSRGLPHAHMVIADHVDNAGSSAPDPAAPNIVIVNGMIKFRIIDDSPLSDVLSQVPLSERIFISGSAATWMAERSLHKATPNWYPRDIDIFACLPAVDFEDIVAKFVHRHTSNCETTIARRPTPRDVVDVTTSNCRYTKSFIRCPPHSSAGDVIQQFDLDICTPLIVVENGTHWVQMTKDVAASILNRRMHCVVRKTNPAYLSYPFQKTMNRVRKYASRGYIFASMKFESATHVDFPECDEESTLNADDFAFECNLRLAKRARPVDAMQE